MQRLSEQNCDQDEKTIDFPHGAVNLVNSVERWYYREVIFQKIGKIQLWKQLRNLLYCSEIDGFSFLPAYKNFNYFLSKEPKTSMFTVN